MSGSASRKQLGLDKHKGGETPQQKNWHKGTRHADGEGAYLRPLRRAGGEVPSAITLSPAGLGAAASCSFLPPALRFLAARRRLLSSLLSSPSALSSDLFPRKASSGALMLAVLTT